MMDEYREEKNVKRPKGEKYQMSIIGNGLQGQDKLSNSGSLLREDKPKKTE